VFVVDPQRSNLSRTPVIVGDLEPGHEPDGDAGADEVGHRRVPSWPTSSIWLTSPWPRSTGADGESRPEQVAENVKAEGIRLDDDALKAIDTALGDIAEKDPAQTKSPGELGDRDEAVVPHRAGGPFLRHRWDP
jgi:hypothetical protein